MMSRYDSYAHIGPTKPSKYAYPGDRCDFRAMISISLFVGKRGRKSINGSVNHIIVRIEDDINFVLDLLCQYESPSTHMGTRGLRRRKICPPGAN